MHLDIVLPVSGIASEVTVTDQPPAIDATQTSLTTAVDKERIEELPVSSRNYLQFILLAPGVSAFTQDHVLAGSLASVFGTQAVGSLSFQAATRRVIFGLTLSARSNRCRRSRRRSSAPTRV